MHLNTDRCPWCGKRVDRVNERRSAKYRRTSHVSKVMRLGVCGNCGHKYGQPSGSLGIKLALSIVCSLVLMILAYIIFPPLILAVLFLVFLLMPKIAPLEKLTDEGRVIEKNSDLNCRFTVVEKYEKIYSDSVYFLNDDFESVEPFATVSPIRVYYAPKRSDSVFGEFLYMHDENYEYMEKDVIPLYDTNMNLVAKIKFHKNNK